MKRILILLSVLSFFTLNPGYVEAGGGKAPAPPPLAITPSTKDVFYVNQKIKFSASGGTAPYSFTSSFGVINKTTGDYTVPSTAGTARVTVTDKKGNTATYNAPVYFYLSISPTSSSVPTSSNYSFAGAGGLAPYKYSTNNGIVGASNGVFSSPAIPGTAVITVTDSRNNKATSNVTIYQSLGITPTTNLIMVGKTFSFFRGTGGMGSYSYSTNKGSIASSGLYTAPADTGDAVVTVTDSRGAKATSAVTIYPALVINPPSLTLVVGKTSTFTSSGGYGSRTFGTDKGGIGPTNGFFTAPTSVGVAVVSVTDGLGNKVSSNVTVVPDLAISPVTINVPVKTKVSFIGSGGITPRTFSASTGIIDANGNYDAPAAGGTAIITVTDKSVPIISKTASICFFEPLVIFPKDKTVLIGKTFNISASGGCKPYTYSIRNGFGSFVAATGNTINYTAPTTPPPNGAKAVVRVTDNAGNFDEAQITISPELALTPPPLTMPISTSHDFIPVGGVPPYTYTVNSGGGSFTGGSYHAPGNESTVRVTVTDNDEPKFSRTFEICVYEPLQIAPDKTVKGLIQGDSFLTFVATHGCKPYSYSKDIGQIVAGSGAYTATQIGKATITVTDLAQKNASSSVTVYGPLTLNSSPPLLKLGTSFKFSATGGIPDLSWIASPGDIAQDGIFTPTVKGVANIVVSDGASHNKNVSITVYEPLNISPAIKTLAVNDKFKFTISGGYFSLVDKMIHVTAGKGIVDEAGNYTAPADVGDGRDNITVKDSAGNIVSTELITIRPALAIDPTFANLEVYQSLNFIVTGGVGNYSYISSIDRRDFDLNGKFSSLKSGLANITVTDQGGHTVTAKVNVYDPVQITPKDKTLAVDDSFDRFTATGGVPGLNGYTFTQDIGSIESKTGVYRAPNPTPPLEAPVTGSVRVTDSLGNPASANITINPSLSLLPEVKNVQVGRERTFTIKGGIGAYTFDTPSKGQISPNGVYKAPATFGPGSGDPVSIIVRDSASPSKHSDSSIINIYDELKISPLSVNLMVGDTYPFTITGGLGTRFPVTDNNLKGTIDSLGGFSAVAEGDVKITVTDSENDPYPNYVVPNKVEADVHIFPSLRLDPDIAYVEAGSQKTFTIIGGVGNKRFDTPSKGDISPDGVYTAPTGTNAAGPVNITVWDEGNKHSFTAQIIVYDKLAITTNPVDRRDLAEGNSVQNRVPLVITGGVRQNDKYKFVEASIGSIDSLTGDYVAPLSIGNQTSVVARVTVTDYLDKTAFLEITIHPALTISPSPAIMAVNRTLNFQAYNGVPTYSYSVKEVNGTIRNLMTPSYTATTAGIVYVTARDILGNTATSVVTVNGEIEINPKNIVLVKVGTKSFTANGGVGNLVFSVSNGNGTIDPITGNFTALKAGDVEVIVTDSEGIAVKIPAKVKVYDPLRISPTEKNLAVTDTFKFEITGGYFSGRDKMIHVTVGKGQIDENGNYTAPAEVGDGKDIVTVKDSDGNIVTANVYINTALAVTPKKEFLLVNGKLSFTVSGGVAPYTYNSSKGSIFSNKSVNNTIGNFTAPSSKDEKVIITVRDNAQPVHEVTAEVYVYEPLKISPPNKAFALGGNTFNFTASGGVPGATGYVFGFETKIGDIITDGILGKYTPPPLNGQVGPGIITLRDSINNLVTATIGVNTSLAVNPPSSLPVNSDLDFNTIVSGGVPGYIYDKPLLGSIDTSGNYHAPPEGGDEEVIIHDSDGITIVAKFCVFKPLTISPNSKILVATTDTETFEAREGCKPYHFEVAGGGSDLGTSSVLFRALQAGVGTVKVIDNVGHNVTANITINPSLAITPPTANLVVNGKKDFKVSGGIAPYLYNTNIGTIASNKSVNNITGYFSAPADIGTATVTVTDNAQPAHTITATVNVYGVLKITPEKNEIAVGDTIKYTIEGGFLSEGGSYKIGPVGGSSDDTNRTFTATTADTDSVKGSLTVTDQAEPEVNSAFANIKINPALTLTSENDKVAVEFEKTLKFIANGGVGTRTFSVEAGQGSIDPSSGLYTAPSKEIGVVGTATITVTDTANHKKSITISIYPPLDITLEHYDLAVTNETHYYITGGFGSSSSYKVESGSEKQPAGGIYTAPGQVPALGKDTVKVTDEAGNEASVVANIYPALKINPLSAIMAVGRNQLFQGVDGVPYKAVDGGPYYRFSVKVGDGEDNNLTTGNYTATASGEVKVTVWDAMGNSAFSIVTVNKAIEIDSPSYLAVGGNKKINARDGVGVLKFYFVNQGANQGDIGELSGVFTAPASKGLVYIKAVDEQGIAAETWINVYNPVEIDPTEKIIVAGSTPFEFTAKNGSGNIASIGNPSGIGPYFFSSDAIIGSILTNGNKGAFTTVPIAGVPQNGITAKVSVKDFLGSQGLTDEVASATVTVNPALSLDPKPLYLAKGANSTFNFGTSTHGGIPPYTYEPADKFSNGIYTASEAGEAVKITVTDNAGTSVDATFCVYDQIEFDPAGDKILAKDNSFTFGAKGGCKPYSFSSTIGSIGSSSGEFSSSITGFGDITVTDAFRQTSAQIRVTINPKLTIEPQGESIEVSKAGTPNSLIFTAHDGVPPYRSINLGTSPKGTIVFVGGVTANYTAPLNPGSDVVIVTDDFGNTAQATVSVYGPLDISPPELQNIEVNTPAISFKASGGVPAYTFSLFKPLGNLSSSGDTASFNPGGTKGDTKVVLRDTKNNTKEVDINVYLPLMLSPNVNQTIGKNGKITFTASEGLPGPLGYIWSVSPSASLIVSADNKTAEFSAPNITQLTNFTVTVMDSIGAPKSRSTNVTVSLPIIISPKTLDIAAKGSSSFSATGGYEPYKFTTTIGAIDLNSGAFNALNNSGTGKVTVTDFAGLTDFANVTVIPGLTIMPTQASVQINGSYDFILSGGILPYFVSPDKGSYSIHPGGFTYTAPGAAGDAVVTAWDSSTPPNEVFASVKIYSGLGIDPPYRTLGINETATFKGTGGVPKYVFSVPPEGGTITTDPAGDGGKGVGNYVFSKMILMDTVTVTDNVGATAQAYVNGNFPSLFIWAFGSDVFNAPGGQGSNAGLPGSRAICANWSDDDGNLWFFGGLGLSPSSARIVLYYFSRYDTKTNQWITYEASARNQGKYPNNPGLTGNTGDFAGARYGAVTWTTDNGKSLWLFGGHGYGYSSSPVGELNDLWKINVSNPTAGIPRSWVSGSKDVNQPGNYGSLVTCPSNLTGGAPPSATTVPGARSKAVSWLDPQGNFWLFGGKGYDCAGTLGYLNDLWKFDMVTTSPNYLKWKWVAGSNKVNSPGQYTNGTDGSGNPTYPTPGAREGAVSWVDVNGDFWLFGGSSSASDFLNGLWKYDRTANRWAFVKGSTSPNQLGIYGNKAEGYPLNNPGSRDGAIGFADSKGNLFLFGGYGYGYLASEGKGFLNDYWRFNTLDGSNNWIWEGGDKTINGLGSHGQLGVASPDSWPGARSYPAFWKDSNGKFWFFGGSRTRNIEGQTGDFYNDMWKFFPK